MRRGKMRKNNISSLSNNKVAKLNGCLTQKISLAEKEHLEEIGNLLHLEFSLENTNSQVFEWLYTWATIFP